MKDIIKIWLFLLNYGLGIWAVITNSIARSIVFSVIMVVIMLDKGDKKYYLSPLLQERFAKYLENKELKTKSQYNTNMSIPEIGEAHGIYGADGISPPIKQQGINIKTRDINQAIEYAMNKSKEEGQPAQLDLYHLQHGEIRPLTTYVPQDSNVARCVQAAEPKEILVYDRKGFDSRRLTPKECFRLMGFLNDEINLDGLSDTQKYKLAGNGQDVNMVSLIFKEMLK